MRPDDNEPDSLHKVLHKVKWLHRRRIMEQFTKVGLTEGQPKILGFLKHNDGCIQRELADHCHIKASTVTNILMNMEKAGLIYRENNPNDRRILNVFLTEKGREANLEIEELIRIVDEECFEGFSKEEKEQAIGLLNRLCNNLDKKGGPECLR